MLNTNNSSAELVIAKSDIRFDSTNIFTRIAKDRLENVNSSQTDAAAKFKMDLGCECVVRAFGYLDTYIVVDILDPQEISTQEPARPENPGRGAPQLAHVTAHDMAFMPSFVADTKTPKAPRYFGTMQENAFPDPNEIPEGAGLETAFLPDNLPEIAQTDVVDDHDPEPEAPKETAPIDAELAETIEVARMKLLEQLTLAAEQGLLDISEPIPDIPDVEISSAAEIVHEIPEEVAPQEVVEEHPIEPIDDKQVNIQSVYDRDAVRSKTHDDTDPNCLSKASLDIASWGDGSNFTQELSAIRMKMIPDLDAIDVRKIHELIRLYVRYGFGAEAKVYLKDYQPQITDYEILRIMATIVDGAALNEDAAEIFQVDCGGAEGLWALITEHAPMHSEVEKSGSIIEYFATLPADLRRTLGPRLAMAFLDHGLKEDSELVTDILERAPGDHGSAHRLSRANLAHEKGDFMAAAAIYHALAIEKTTASNTALTSLAEIMLAHDMPESKSIIFDLSAAANTGRGTTAGANLRRLETLLTAKYSDPKAALAILDREVHTDPIHAAEFHNVAQIILMDLSSKDVPAENYAEIIHKNQHLISADAGSDALRIKISEVLLSISLPNFALDIQAPLVRRHVSEGLLMSAKANLSMFDAKGALNLLENVSGDVARAYRVESFLAQGRFEAGLNELEQFEDPKLAIAQPVWYFGDWVVAAKTDTAARVIRDKYLVETAENIKLPEPHTTTSEADWTLADLQDILAESGAISDAIDRKIHGQ
ncbi:MAG: hypothetical protein V3V13_03090 [Paracoccaceae bacterium]